MKAEEEAAKIKKEAASAEEKSSKLSFPDHFANAVDTLFDRVPALEPLRSTVRLHLSCPAPHHLAMTPMHSVVWDMFWFGCGTFPLPVLDS